MQKRVAVDRECFVLKRRDVDVFLYALYLGPQASDAHSVSERQAKLRRERLHAGARLAGVTWECLRAVRSACATRSAGTRCLS